MSNPIAIQFPKLGVVKRFGVESDKQGEFGTPWSMNCRLEDEVVSRLRGGSFTGISAGTRPSSIVYRDRTLTFSGRAVTASRAGSSTDTTLSADVSDAMRPALFQFSEAGEQGGSVVALVPNRDITLLGFTADETWVQTGNPNTGPRRRVSDEVGIIGADAWCVANDTVYFLSSRGLYAVGADGSGLKAISEDIIPEDLEGITDTTCTLTYQHSDRGVYIHKTGVDWFFDTERGGFWPFDTSTTDSHVLIGPISLGNRGEYGRLMRLVGEIAAESVEVTWRVIVEDTAENAADHGQIAVKTAMLGGDYSSMYHSSGTWYEELNTSVYPKARGQWMVIWLSAENPWAFESITAEIEKSIKWR